jgi:DNA-binding NarL/FixJ family response regulator
MYPSPHRAFLYFHNDHERCAVTTELDRVPVLVRATDPILHGGVLATLRGRPEVRIVTDGELAAGSVVAFVVTDRFTEAARALLRGMRSRGYSRIALVIGDVDETEALAAVEDGACAVARRSQVDSDALVRLAKAAAEGEGALPPDLLGRLLVKVSSLQRQMIEPRSGGGLVGGMRLSAISARETEVLQLVADGFSTKEIADKLCYSERTVKSILHDVTNRFQLRNRSHAVAYALRAGLI